MSRKRPPWYLLLPAALVAAGVLLPLLYLVVQGAAGLAGAYTPRLGELFVRTALLVFLVLLADLLLAFPLAWLLVRVRLPAQRLLTTLAALPLALPGYVLAYALLALGGDYGLAARAWGLDLPRLQGLAGAWLALVIYTYPYLFLNLRSALLDVDPAQEEAARSLGMSPFGAFRRVVLPQLAPALGSGSLLVALHVLGDFGVVSLMRYETFSYAIYLQYSVAYASEAAASLALVLTLSAAALLYLEYRALARLVAGGSRPRGARRALPAAPGPWLPPALGFVLFVIALGLGVPLGVVGSLALHPLAQGVYGDVLGAGWNTLRIAFPAALLAVAGALPLAWLASRYPGLLSRITERVVYLGYAIPPLALGLGFVFLVLRLAAPLYQTAAVLVVALAVHFMAEAIGPIRSALWQLPVRLEEAGRALGESAWGVFWRVMFPLLRRGLLAGALLVFMAAAKELPITYLLAPLGYTTLALEVFSYSEEAAYAEAAPFALALVLLSAGVALGMLRTEKTR